MRPQLQGNSLYILNLYIGLFTLSKKIFSLLSNKIKHIKY